NYGSNDDDPRGQVARVEISDVSGLCAAARDSSRLRSRRSLVLVFATYDPGTGRLYSSGFDNTWPIYAPDAGFAGGTSYIPVGFAQVEDVDSVCTRTEESQRHAVSGQIRTFRPDGGHAGKLAGDFDVTLESGDRLVGEFLAAGCNQLDF